MRRPLNVFRIQVLVGICIAGLGLAACTPEEGSPHSSIPISSDILPYMEERGFDQRVEPDRTIVSRNGVDLWSDRENCFRYCAIAYVGPRGLDGEVSEQFRMAYLASRDALMADNRALLDLPARKADVQAAN
ncbi:hypothetical protein [Paracoccus sp. ME4]|uniref:hypothetical protein n=1 Tax=Paracoccus sp. ME4 TaxID=3138066 RepID=UPI00398B6090